MLKYLFACCLLLFATLANGQQLGVRTAMIADSIGVAPGEAIPQFRIPEVIESYQIHTSEIVESNQYKRVRALIKVADEKELLLLTESENATIKCAAFYALCAKSSAFAGQVLLSHLNDTSKVHIQLGCIGEDKMTGDYFMETMFFLWPGMDSATRVSNYKALYLADSIIFNQPFILLKRKTGRLRNMEPKQADYKRVRQIAIEEKLPEAVLALAKYRNQQDIGIIKDYFNQKDALYYTFWAVKDFPDTSFFTLLEAAFNEMIKQPSSYYPERRVLYQALAQYPTDKTVELFSRLFKTKNKNKRKELLWPLRLALDKYPNSKFFTLEQLLQKEVFSTPQVDFKDDDIKAEL